MPDQPPPIQSPQPVLAYRAVRFVWRIGTAPRLIDGLMILLTGALIFASIMLLAVGSMDGQPLLCVLALVPWPFVLGLWYWSNHFHKREPVGLDEMTESDRRTLKSL